MDHLDRKSLKILADSTRESQGESELTRNLESAARSGDRAQYVKARDSFDALPPEQRRTIGAGAVVQAETVKVQIRRRKAVDTSPGAAQDSVDLAWLMGSKTSGKAPETAPVRQEPSRLREPKQARQVRQAPLADDESGNWNWQDLPEDPRLQGRGKQGGKTALQQLREQMLGADMGHTWRRSLPSGE